MTTHSEIVKNAGKPEDVALACGVSVHTVKSWIFRNSIPAEHWADFAGAGWATLDDLAEIARAKKVAA